jgi:hypothetical protein
MVREDFPEPETPVTTISLFRGIVTVTFLRLWTRAPRIRMSFAEFTVFVSAGFFPIIVFSILGIAKVKPYLA